MSYGPIVLAGLLLEYTLVMGADVLNLRALKSELPKEFAGVYDPARYSRSQDYTRELTRFGWIERTFDLALLLAFWFSGGFEWLDRSVRAFGYGPIITGTVYIGLLVIAQQIVSLPFRSYSTFVIEERFGFNTTTQATFVIDIVKTLLLTVVLGAPLLAAVLWFFSRTGDAAWLWCLGAITLFLVVFQLVAPIWIMPLFNKFKPIENSEVAEAVLDFARRAGFPVEGLFVIDGSKRSTKANAFLSGFGKRKRIALYDTLLPHHSTDELVAIVAHEIGHYKKKHVLKEMMFAITQIGAFFFLLSVFLHHEALFKTFDVSQPSTYANLILFAIAYTPISFIFSLVVQARSRRNEFEADAFARETIGRGEALARALEKLNAESLSNLTPHPFYVKLHHSHPPLADRVAALTAQVQPTTSGGR